MILSLRYCVFASYTIFSTKASDKQIQELFQQIGEVAYVEIFPKEKWVEYDRSFRIYCHDELDYTIFIELLHKIKMVII